MVDSTSIESERTVLVNMHAHGRDGVTPIDRSSKFGSKFRLKKDGGEYTRAESVAAYKEWFLERIADDSEFRQSVRDLEGKTLGCWCVEEPVTDPQEPYETCHGEIILAYLQGHLADQ